MLYYKAGVIIKSRAIVDKATLHSSTDERYELMEPTASNDLQRVSSHNGLKSKITGQKLCKFTIGK
jgi:hypothetical protein